MARALLIAEKPSLMREVQAVYKTMNYPDEIDFKCFRGHTMTLYAPADYTKDWEKWDLNTLPMIPKKFKYKVIEDDRGDYLHIYQDIKISNNNIESGPPLIAATTYLLLISKFSINLYTSVIKPPV